MNALFSFDLVMVYIPEFKQHLKLCYNTCGYEILYTCWAVVLLLPERRAIINDLDVILQGFVLQIIYTTVFRVKHLNNLTPRVRLLDTPY